MKRQILKRQIFTLATSCAIAATLLGGLCAQAVAVPIGAKPVLPMPRPAVGMASWYGDAHHDKMTASGHLYQSGEFTAAHPTLPFGSEIRVTNLSNSRSVVLTITDRGPFTQNRIIDVSEAAASALNFKNDGLARVMLSPAIPVQSAQR